MAPTCAIGAAELSPAHAPPSQSYLSAAAHSQTSPTLAPAAVGAVPATAVIVAAPVFTVLEAATAVTPSEHAKRPSHSAAAALLEQHLPLLAQPQPHPHSVSPLQQGALAPAPSTSHAQSHAHLDAHAHAHAPVAVHYGHAHTVTQAYGHHQAVASMDAGATAHAAVGAGAGTGASRRNSLSPLPRVSHTTTSSISWAPGVPAVAAVTVQPQPSYPLAPIPIRPAAVSATVVGQPLPAFAAQALVRNSTPDIIAQLRPPSSPQGPLPPPQSEGISPRSPSQLAFVPDSARTPGPGPGTAGGGGGGGGGGPGTAGGGRRRAPQTPTLLQVASPPMGGRHSRGGSMPTPTATPVGLLGTGMGGGSYGGGGGGEGRSPGSASSFNNSARSGMLPSLSLPQAPGTSGYLSAQLQPFRLATTTTTTATTSGGDAGAARSPDCEGTEAPSLIAAHNLLAAQSIPRRSRWIWGGCLGFSVGLLLFGGVYAMAHGDGGYATINPGGDAPLLGACATYAAGVLVLLCTLLRLLAAPSPYRPGIGLALQVGLTLVALGLAALMASLDRSDVLSVPGGTPLLLGVQVSFLGAACSFLCFCTWVHGAPARSTQAALVLLGSVEASAVSRDIRTMRAMNVELIAAHSAAQQARRSAGAGAGAGGAGLSPNARPVSVGSTGPGTWDSSRPVTGAQDGVGSYDEPPAAVRAGLVRMNSLGGAGGGALGASLRASRRAAGRKGKSIGSYGGNTNAFQGAFQGVGMGGADASATGGAAAVPDSAALKHLLASNMALAAKVAQLESQQHAHHMAAVVALALQQHQNMQQGALPMLPPPSQSPTPTLQPPRPPSQSQKHIRQASNRVADGGAVASESNHAVWKQTIGVL